MRILNIRFKNLNSLVGEWEIDLSHPAFASDGIFAITGPTGAGKTTILDAICLALYGRTPRLNKVTKSENEIMSRQTGECYAEVIFETQAGRYRCHWGQHRARKKADGELQAPKHEIGNPDTGEVFESKIRGVAEQIELAAGMDFDRFTRSMLLAQGDFTAFLQAAPDERAPILEQITGTEIYSLISMRVHEKNRDEREKLRQLQAETAGIIILEPDQEKEIELLLESSQKEEADLSTRAADTGKAIAWLTAIDELKKEVTSLAAEASDLNSCLEEFKPDREKLNRSLNAATLDGLYATLSATRKQQDGDRNLLIAEEESLPKLETSAAEQADILKTAEQHTGRVKYELKAATPTLQKVRSLDQKLADLKKTVEENEENCKKYAAEIDADKQLIVEEKGKRSEIQAALDLTDNYLKKHAADEWLVGNLASVEEQLNDLLTRQKDILQQTTEQEKATEALEQAAKLVDKNQKQTDILKRELEDVLKQLQQNKNALNQLLGDRLLREYRADKEALLREMAFLTKIAELEDHRAKLEDGKECPLCGATEHPFAEGNVPAPDETEQKIEALNKLISRAENQETEIKKLEAAENLARKNLTKAEKLETEAINDRRSSEKTLAGMESNLEKLRVDFAERRRAVSTKLMPLGITEISEKDLSSILDTLKTRLNIWQKQIKKKADIEKQIADLGSEIKRLEAVVETQNTALTERQRQLEILKENVVDGNDERKMLYGDKSPDDEEFRLNKTVSDAEVAEKQARDEHSILQQKLSTAKTRAETLKKRIDQRDPELSELETKFTVALLPLGFANEEEFLAAMLPSELRAELMAKAKDLDERQTDLKSRQLDREKRLTSEIAKQVTDKTLEELEPQFKEYEDSLKELREHIASIKYKLSDNAAARERLKEKQTAIEVQKNECSRWDNLHELIGSGDGKKYRNFAQGLTFEMMIGHANQQLQKMTDRYLLTRVYAQPLELNVVDNYQAGESRSTKNLSGGESFIVSLSLALGLSQMASKNVRVDSLFLDEGFGTLDEEALDTALETLASLQQDGKLIGVISHVPALKERIGTQILVTPQTGGRSQITGIGCSKIPATI